MRQAQFDHSGAESVEVYTIDRLRRTYSLGRQAIYSALKSGELPAFKLGTRTLIRKAHVDAWLSRQPAYEPETV